MSAQSQSTTLLTPKQTLAAQEADRMRVFVGLVLVMALVAASSPAWLPVPPEGLWVLALAVLAVLPSGVWFGWRLSRGAYTPGRALAFGMACVAGGTLVTVLLGPLSPSAAFLALAVFVFAPGQERGAAIALFATAASLYALALVAFAARLVPDLVAVPSELSPVLSLVILALVELLLLLSFWIGRTTRKTTLFAIEERDRALRAVAQRAQLLKEAHEELARAVRGGGLGRFTDETFGRYRLGTVIGRGGMGEVYEAVEAESGREAAVKVLYPHIAVDPAQLTRFLREATIAMGVESAYVCRVLDVGSAPVPFMALERLRGEDLSDRLRRRERLPLAEVVDIVKEVAVALEAARAAGIVHRDVKPRNIFLATDGAGGERWKVLDFGVSKYTESSGTLTQGHIVGTPGYMAPEQATGGKVDHRADVFSLGVVAYRSLTGRPPFVGDSMPETLYQVVHAHPAPPSTQVAVPEDVDLVLALAMAKKAEERFATARDFATALASAAAGGLDRVTRDRGRRQLAPAARSPAAGGGAG